MVYSNHSSDVLYFFLNCEHFWCKRLPQHVEVSFHWSDNIASRRGKLFGSCRMLVASISMQLGGLGTISGACDFESLVLEPQNRRGPVWLGTRFRMFQGEETSDSGDVQWLGSFRCHLNQWGKSVNNPKYSRHLEQWARKVCYLCYLVLKAWLVIESALLDAAMRCLFPALLSEWSHDQCMAVDQTTERQLLILQLFCTYSDVSRILEGNLRLSNMYSRLIPTTTGQPWFCREVA